MAELKIAVIGGGPSGLLLGRLLTEKSIPYIIFERDASPASRSQGGTLDIREDSGIIALKEAGLYEAFLKHARPEGMDLVVADKTGKRWLNLKGTREKPVGTGRPEIDRQKLREILIASVPAERIKWGTTVKSVTEDGRVHLSTSKTEGPFDLVVGADGGFSHVRPLLTEAKAFYSGICGAEFYFENVDETRSEIGEHVGQGSFVTFSGGMGMQAQRMADKSIRMSAYGRRPESWAKEFLAKYPNGGEKAKNAILDEFYSDWAPEFQDWIMKADDKIVTRSLYMLPVGIRWEPKSKITLVGDAAHLWTPFAGQGVNAALVDSLELSRAIEKSVKSTEEGGNSLSLDETIKEYESVMFERTRAIAEETKQGMDLWFRADFPPKDFDKMIEAKLERATKRRPEAGERGGPRRNG